MKGIIILWKMQPFKVREQGWGLLNIYAMPYEVSFVSFALSIILLDMVVYLQHLMFHAVPLPWRLHMVHHADLGYDVTTSILFRKSSRSNPVRSPR